MIVIQDPSNPSSTYLLESLLDACDSATKFAGAFAFASSAGVRLVTDSDTFAAIARDHEIDLVVGIDAVTNNAALDALLAVSKPFPKFRVRAFLNPKNDVIFHPKFCWTRVGDAGSIITGSGNLTEAGLLGNWEAYAYDSLDAAGIGSVEATWKDWVTRHDQSLRPLDDQEVRDRATQNTVMARQGDLPVLRSPRIVKKDPSVNVSLTVVPTIESADVLIAEIPRSGNRWKQANFDKHNYEHFFGARVGEQRLIVFRHVEEDGQLSPYERSRPSVEVKSQNYRFELDAASGLDYPDDGRPIAVFIRIATRTFLYHLLMPSDQEYPRVMNILNERDSESNVRRERMSENELRDWWPTAPFWKIEDV